MTWDVSRFAVRRFATIADLLTRLPTDRMPDVATLDACLRPELASIGIRLVESPKTKLGLGPDGTIDPLSLYEVRIHETGEVPTRPDNMHDLLNAMIWAAFPHSKRALTAALAAIQRARAIGRATLPMARSRDHDRLAMIDEGGVIRARDGAWIFGHAIFEHAYAGEFGVRGIVLEVDAAGSRDAIDRAFAAVIPNAAAAQRGHAGEAIDDATLRDPV
jgi:hypothetical protein